MLWTFFLFTWLPCIYDGELRQWYQLFIAATSVQKWYKDKNMLISPNLTDINKYNKNYHKIKQTILWSEGKGVLEKSTMVLLQRCFPLIFPDEEAKGLQKWRKRLMKELWFVQWLQGVIIFYFNYFFFNIIKITTMQRSS